MKTRTSPIADLATLSERYGMKKNIIRSGFSEATERHEMHLPWEFDGVLLWGLDEADAWFCRRLRAEYDVRQGELSDALDVTQSTVSKWENHQASVPEYLVPKLRRIIEEIAAAKKEAA